MYELLISYKVSTLHWRRNHPEFTSEEDIRRTQIQIRMRSWAGSHHWLEASFPSYYISNITFLHKHDAVIEAESEILFQEK